MFRYPCDYIAITQNYKEGLHNGIDLGHSDTFGGPNHEIKASLDGKVFKMRMDYKTTDTTGNSYGNYIEIDHGEFHTIYAHLVYNSSSLKVGDPVLTRQVIARMGETGRAVGIHVHFEIIKNGVRVDPLPYLYVDINQVVKKETEERYSLHYKSKNGGGQKMTYEVQAGDVLWKIAEKFGTTVLEIASLNNLENPNLLHPGQVLTIPTGEIKTETNEVEGLKKEIEDLKNRLKQIASLSNI